MKKGVLRPQTAHVHAGQRAIPLSVCYLSVSIENRTLSNVISLPIVYQTDGE